MKNHVVPFIIVFVLLALTPFALSLFHIHLLTEVLILGVFALSLNILVGYTGLVSLGHAAFFGVGAYTAALAGYHLSSSLFVTMGLAILCSIVLAAIIGIFCVKVNGFYFLMLTLAFSQMIYSFIHQSSNLTGGSNGFSSIPTPTIMGWEISNSVYTFYLILVIFFFIYAILRTLVHSPFGKVLIGIRENETRVKAMGYNTQWFKYAAFIIAGAIGGMSGSLYTYFNGFVSPSDVYWTMSGTVLIMVLIGGAGTMLGPVLGAAFIVILETIIASYTDMWMFIIGAVFIIFVIFFPNGIYGIGQNLSSKLFKYQGETTLQKKSREV